MLIRKFKVQSKKRMKFIGIWMVSMMLPSGLHAATWLKNLKVEYRNTPLAVGVMHPRFAWQMEVDDKSRGNLQSAYRISVIDETGKEVWNTGKVKSTESLGIQYAGESLRPSTRYQWHLTVWNQKNEELQASSAFETALVLGTDYNHPVATAGKGTYLAWEGAKWIGRGNAPVMFYAPYFPTFRLHYELQLDKKSKSTAASFIFGANDPRLMDRNKNLLGVSNAKDSSYIRVELDIAPLRKSKPARINFYRRGYKVGETDAAPLVSYDIPAAVINRQNQYAAHQIDISMDTGAATLFLDGKEIVGEKVEIDTDGKLHSVGSLILNPTGEQGNNYIAYPMLVDWGYYVAKGQKATFSHIEVRNFKSPQNVVAAPLQQLSASQLSANQLSANQLSVDGKKEGALGIFAFKENTAPMLRTEFATSGKKVRKARLYATARGIYDIYIDGKAVSRAYFNPGTTEYNHTHTYQTFDVTSLLQQSGEHAIGAVLSEGWWSGGATYVTGNWNFYGDRQSLMAKLQITYEDGSQQTIVTDPATWKSYDDGAVRYGSFFMGEVYDARKEQDCKGWAMPHFDDRNWQTAVEVKESDFKTSEDFQLLPDMAEAIMPVDTLTALNCVEPRKGVYVYDLGQNMAGVPLVHFSGLKPGTEVKIRTAEIKYPDLPAYQDYVGMIMTENLRVATSQDVYVARGGEETFSPRYTLHGFRYLEITGVDAPVAPDQIKAIVVSSMNEQASQYSTSRSDINRLWLNSVWSTRSNFMSVPTDCPQRNERLGWMGDISVFGRSATYITDASQFLRRYLISVRDLQSAKGQYPDVAPTNCGFGGLLWASAGVTLPWELYQQYGDKAMLAEHYASMKRYIQFVLDEYVDKKTGLIVQHHQWGDLGDWLSPSYEKDDKSLVWECYFIFDLDILSQMAKALGKTEDAAWLTRLANERRAFFRKTFVDEATGKTICSWYDAERKGQLIDTQTSYALPLAFHVVDGDLQKKMAAHLAAAIKTPMAGYPAYSLLTGFIGTAWISKALSDNGMSEEAYRLLQYEGYPSWLYPVKNGATTIWERLNSYTVKDGFGENNSMNSFNHYSFGAVASWMYNYSLGICRDEKSPGFKHFILKPEVDPTRGITHAEGYYDSMYGRISSRWQYTDSGIRYEFTVPANTTASLYLPAPAVSFISENGKPLKKASGVRYVSADKELHHLELASGFYQFDIKQK